MAANIELRTTDPDSLIITLAHLGIEGKLHHTWLEPPLGVPTPHVGRVQPGPRYGEEWGKFDSHLLIRPEMVGGGAGAGLGGVRELNDGSTSISDTLPTVNGMSAVTAIA